MFEIMHKERGIGLAAPQIDIGKRIIVVDTGEERSRRLALINPEILEFSDNLEPYEEGCLSVPRLLADVVRPAEIVIRGINTNGNEVEFEASGLMARVLQHEIDHLNGILFIDRIEKFIRDEFRTELKKIKKLNRLFRNTGHCVACAAASLQGARCCVSCGARGQKVRQKPEGAALRIERACRL
jgi:peptide deformylase